MKGKGIFEIVAIVIIIAGIAGAMLAGPAAAIQTEFGISRPDGHNWYYQTCPLPDCLFYEDSYINVAKETNTYLVAWTSTLENSIPVLQRQYNMDKTTIFALDKQALDAERNGDKVKSWQLFLQSREIVKSAILSDMTRMVDTDINTARAEISNATALNADTAEAETNLNRAQINFTEGNYFNASIYADRAFQYARISNVSIGYRSIKDLPTQSDFYSKYQNHKVTVETGGFIRDIKSYGTSYSFSVDDGAGVIGVTYSGGLGDIKEGDTVDVKGVYRPGNINAESVKKGSGLVGSSSSNIKAPGFEAILAVIGIFGVLWLRRKL